MNQEEEEGTAMKNGNPIRRAAMGALVAAALMAGVQQANAGPYRFPADTPSWMLPWGRAKLVDAGNSIMAQVKVMLSSVRLFPEGGVRVLRFPAKAQRSD
jgi:hypothetical protein